jgi:hypothetical protein
VKLDPQKTAAALASAYITQIIGWASNYFWHVSMPLEVSSAVSGLLFLFLSHVSFPPQ